MKVSREVLGAAAEVVAASPSSLAETLRGFIARFVGSPFLVSDGFLADDDTTTDHFGCVVHTEPAISEGREAGVLPADCVAAVIDTSETLSLEGLRGAYSRIAQAKRLKKKPEPARTDGSPTTVILGIIFTQKSDVPLDLLSDELEQLNQVTPGKERTDMLVVATTGVINYGVQFPGEGVAGDFLPPAEEALSNHTPAMYIAMLIKPTEEYSLNKMLSLLVAHLAIFSPGAKVPAWDDILQGVTRHALIARGYQYNLQGELLPVPEEMYRDRYFAPLPVRIEDRKGKLLATLSFLPWQDGAVVLLEGAFPLEAFLIFLGPKALQRGRIVKRGRRQISHVMPITEADFRQMLSRIQRQSNMVVRPVKPTWTVQKVFDEGSSSPFMARLMIGMFDLRDAVFDAAERDAFDRSYDIVLKALISARDARLRLVEIWKEHEGKVAAGKVSRITEYYIR